MTDNLDKNLAVFLTSCKESALRELSESNSEYKKLLADMAESSKRIYDISPDDYENFTNNFYALTRMEMNYLYFRGFKDCINLYKRFDGSFIESLGFEKFFV